MDVLKIFGAILTVLIYMPVDVLNILTGGAFTEVAQVILVKVIEGCRVFAREIYRIWKEWNGYPEVRAKV